MIRFVKPSNDSNAPEAGRMGPATMGAAIQNSERAGPVSFFIPTPPSTNKLFINRKAESAGRGRAKTAAYFDFVGAGITAIKRQDVQPVEGRVLVCVGVERMASSADIDNRVKALFDVIVKAEIISDDKMITGFAISWLPKADGLTWVSIFPVGPMAALFHPSPDGASGAWIFTPQNSETQ